MKKGNGAVVALLLRVALVLPALGQATAQEASGASEAPNEQLEAVVVTAQKRSENVQDVPSAISVLTGDYLEQQNIKSVNELSGYVAGLAISNSGKTGQLIVIHGIASGLRNFLMPALTATYIDDLPVGSSSAGARGGAYSSEVMPYDLERIEVLKGPQGTLYGANAMGGLIKYTLRKPDLDNFEAKMGVGAGFLDESRGTDRSARGAVSLPIVAGKLAVRISGFFEDTPGWIDNIGTQAGAAFNIGRPGTGNSDSNTVDRYGMRVALLWVPTDRIQVQASFLENAIRTGDSGAIEMKETFTAPPTQPMFGWDTRSTAFLSPEYLIMRNYALHLDWDLGFAQLASSTSFAYTYRYEFSDFTGNPALFAPQYPSAYNLFNAYDTVHKYTTEARLSGPSDRRIVWMLGAFVTYEQKNERYNNLGWSDQNKDPLPAPFDKVSIGTNPQPPLFLDRSLFANATYKFTDRFDVSAGGRFDQLRNYGCTDGQTGPRGVPGVCYDSPLGDYQGNWTWMGDTRFHFDRDTMLYARVATGYRPGGVNPGVQVLKVLPTFAPDSVINYEAGIKATELDDRLQVAADAFDIEWKDIQVTVISPQTGAGYISNGKTARSRGVEFTTDYLLRPGLKLGLVFAYTDAHLTADAPALAAKAGDPLPVTGKISGSLSADYTWRLAGEASLFAGGIYRHRDRTYSLFKSAPHPLPLPAQDLVDVQTGLNLKKTSIRLSVQNIFNDRSFIGAELGNFPGEPAYAPVQPRTLGLNVDYTF